MTRTAERLEKRIRPWSENPRYWEYRGEPVLLLGGTREDNLFQIPDCTEQLELLSSVGGNYIRNTMSDRDEGNVYPYARLSDGRYDLDRWNEEYWKRFESMLLKSWELDIIVQIEVWDRFDLSDAKSMHNWRRHPYRPANNRTYTAAESGLKDAYPDHPSADLHPFFHTVPGAPGYRKEYDLLRRYQERFVAKLLSITLPFGNVLYCMDNETSTDPGWGRYWMSFVKSRASEAGVDVFVTDMFDDAWKPEESAALSQAIGDPDAYDFLDISQINSRNFGEAHWNRMRWIAEQTADSPRPLNHTKIYSAGETAFGSGTPQDGIERFWRNLLGGSASVRFHRPTAGIGLNETAQRCIRAAREVEALVRFWSLGPRNDLIVDRAENHAYLSADPGNAYVLFLPFGGDVRIDLDGLDRVATVDWFGIVGGERKREEGRTFLEDPASHRITVAAPDRSAWVAVLRCGGR